MAWGRLLPALVGGVGILSASMAAAATTSSSFSVSVEVRSSCSVGASRDAQSAVRCSLPTSYESQVQQGSLALTNGDEPTLTPSADGLTLVVTY